MVAKVLNSLNLAAKDRVHKVQNAEMLAKEDWEKLMEKAQISNNENF